MRELDKWKFDLNLKDKANKTPLSYAKEQKSQVLYTFLKSLKSVKDEATGKEDLAPGLRKSKSIKVKKDQQHGALKISTEAQLIKEEVKTTMKRLKSVGGVIDSTVNEE